MTKNLLAGVLLMPCCVAWAAAPVISEVTFSQDANTRIVTAEYTLANGPAFVTAEFIAAGQSIGQPVRAVTGAALSTTDGAEAPLDRIVESGRHSFQWRIDADAPGVSEAAATLKIRAWESSAPPEYMLIGLDRKNDVHYYASTNELPFGPLVTNEVYLSDYLLMRRIPARGARWRMGLPVGHSMTVSQYAGHDTLHYVNMTNDYYIGVFEFTQRQYWKMMGKEIGKFTNETTYAEHWLYPAADIDHSVAVALIDELKKVTDADIMLPTEEQWEYACRAGTATAFSNGAEADGSDLRAICWYGNNANSRLHKVGTKLPNSWGLYDMHGNAAEITSSRYNDSVSADEITEPIARTGGSYVQRGGCYNYSATAAASSAGRANLGDSRGGVRLLVPAPDVGCVPPTKLDVTDWPFWGCDDAVTNRASCAWAESAASAPLVSLDAPFEILLGNQNLRIQAPGMLMLFR